MESVGEEKRIRALFSELKLADKQSAPGFVGVWNRAQLDSMRPRRAFNFSFVAATALLVCALLSLAIWSKQSQRNLPAKLETAVHAPKAVETVPATINEPAPSSRYTRHRTQSPLQVRKTNNRQAVLAAANEKILSDARTIESWSSPTSNLLSSPGSEVLNSLPQLNENATDMKSFLPAKPR